MATAMTRRVLSPAWRHSRSATQQLSQFSAAAVPGAPRTLARALATTAAQTGNARPRSQQNQVPAQSQRRALQTSTPRSAPGPSPLLGAMGGFGGGFGGGAGSASGIPAAYFQKPSLPANTIVRFVPQQTAWLVERMGKFHRILQPGLAILIPFLDRIAYVKSLKEVALEIPSQSAITADNVTLELDGVLYTRVFDAYKASYGVEDAEYAISQLAQTTMRSEIGQLTLDHVLKERAALNTNITAAINEAAQAWGVTCLRYEIRDIHAPAAVVEAMHRQVTAERSKRAEILDSEGQRQSAINIAEGKKQSVILASEALRAETINRADGEADAIRLRADATAAGLAAVARSIASGHDAAHSAVALSVAEKYVAAFGQLARESTAVVVPGNVGDLAGLVATALNVYGKVGGAAAAGAASRSGQDNNSSNDNNNDGKNDNNTEPARQLLEQNGTLEPGENRGLTSEAAEFEATSAKNKAMRDRIVEDFDKAAGSR
ncbi:stomatin family protein [Niveomyces insectorum RCEF 264]|uniref:Stomatin family protein n=1 Tax=Niveomyces insectorum RCEF 264 TaxID=1081102 RepID=A0A167SSN2_9HYPO|nr:stomatin family protein [Niveomyces insectorum RCEF 264]